MTFYLTMYSLERTLPPVAFVLASIDAGNSNTFSMERGSRQVIATGDGRAQDTFRLYVKQESTDALRTRIGYLRNLLREARLYHAQTAHTNPIYIEETTDGELPRRALVYGGAIEVVDDDFDQWTLYGAHATFVVTIDRAATWEWTEAAEWLPTPMEMHGGQRTTASSFWKGDGGRIEAVTVRPRQGGIKRIWMGIKPAAGGRDISGFNPNIRVGNARVRLGPDARFVSTSSSDPGWLRYHDDSAVEISFSSTQTWNFRVSADIQQWNTSTATEANRRAYVGEYHLLARYQTSSGDTSVNKFGIEASLGWLGSSLRVPLGPQYVKRTNNRLRYVNLGRLRIGEGWGSRHYNDLVMKTLTVYLDAAVFDYESGDRLVLDNMRLVPAEHSLYIELPNLIGNDRKVVTLANERGELRSYVTYGWDLAADVLAGQIYDEAAAITAENWTMPPDPQSQFVLVADSGDEGSLPYDFKADVQMRVVPRTELYR